ncbi:MAG TPA: hypothetical protein VFE86_10335, partial [Ilumatobacteraceae bacterium]|nr:hypothetical protein [Ilumatobacteraceae bacterium]
MRGLKMLSTSAACLALVGGAIAIGVVPSSPPAQRSRTDQQRQIADAFSKLPVSFTENRGQTDAAVRYYAQGNRFAFYMTPNEVMMSFLDRQRAVDDAQSPLRLALALRFINSDPMVEPHGAEQSPGVVNDLRGPDSRTSHTGIPQFRDVVYGGLWPGI